MAVLIIAVSSVAFFAGYRHALNGLTITRVTADQIAQAMAEDHFYSDYGRSTLVVQGTVSAVSGNPGHRVITFQTASTFGALCESSAEPVSPRPGDHLTVVASGANADRLASAVMLRTCLIT